MAIVTRQREQIEKQKKLAKKGIRLGKRYVYWVSRTAPDGSVYREYYLTNGQAHRRAYELAGIPF